MNPLYRANNPMECNDNPVILVITRDVIYFEKIKYYIEQHRYTITLVTDVTDAVRLHEIPKINLIIISDDVLNSAYDIFKLWVVDDKIKYMVVTDSSHSCETLTINYLESGATDVVDKSIRCQLLLAKIRVLLSLADTKLNLSEQAKESLNIGLLEINSKLGLAVYNKRNLNLTTNEFSLLLLFLRKPNQIFSREKLYKTLFKYEYDGISRSIDNTVFRIRRKLDNQGITDVKIKSIRGRGYCALLSE